MTVQIVALPTSPPPLNATLALTSYATEMTGPLGGPTQRVLRVGSRWKADFEMSPLPYDAGRQWLARMVAGEANPVSIYFPQRGLIPVAPNAGAVMCVNGAQTATSNTGLVLSVRNGAPGFTLLSGQFFHVNASVDGRRYVHQLLADTVIGSNGTDTLNIQPPLRFVPADGDTLEWVTPTIEGFVAMNWNWSIELVRRIGLKFSITEDR